MSDHYFPMKTRPHIEVLKRTRGRLPHWEIENALYFVTLTLNLIDSLPAGMLDRLTEQCRLKVLGQNYNLSKFSRQNVSRIARLKINNIEKILDKGYGSAVFMDRENTEIMIETLNHFNGTRFHLHSYCVMPNHVHLIFQSINGHGLKDIVKSWKGWSSREINRIQGWSGSLWKREYFDRIIRDEHEYSRMVNYVMENPDKAGLKNWPYVWKSEQLIASVLMNS